MKVHYALWDYCKIVFYLTFQHLPTFSSATHLVRLVTDVAAKGLGSHVCDFVFVEEADAGEHLVADWTRVKLLRVELLNVLPMLLQ